MDVTATTDWSVDPPSAGSITSGGEFTAGSVPVAIEATIQGLYSDGEFSVAGGAMVTIIAAEAEIPTVSTWGLVTMMVLVLAAGTLVLTQRLRVAGPH
jgi:hypothetical protein